VLHALGVGLGTEDIDGLVVGRTVSLKAFVALLAVIEGGCHSMDAQEGRLYELRCGPFASLDGVGGFDVAVHFMVSTTLFKEDLHLQDILPSRTLKPTLSQSDICVTTRLRWKTWGCYYTNCVDGRRRE
jgi:hypothetical protein